MLWRKLVLSLLLVPSLDALHGQDIVGQWQGTVQTAAPFRVVLKVLKNNNQLRAFIIRVDQSSDYFPVTSFSDPNGEVKFSIDKYASFDGKVSSGRNQIAGTWTSGVESVKLDLHRATPEESWLTKSTIRMITVAPNVSLEVVDWGGNGPPLVFSGWIGEYISHFRYLSHRSFFPNTMCLVSPDLATGFRVLLLPIQLITAQISWVTTF